MDRKTPVSEIMTRELVTANPDDSLKDVSLLMQDHGIHHIPVVNTEGILMGILSMSDIRSATLGASMMRNEQREKQTEILLSSLLAEEVMQSKVVRLKPEDSLETAVGIFRENRFHALPVCANREIVGMITPLDIINYIFREG